MNKSKERVLKYSSFWGRKLLLLISVFFLMGVNVQAEELQPIPGVAHTDTSLESAKYLEDFSNLAPRPVRVEEVPTLFAATEEDTCYNKAFELLQMVDPSYHLSTLDNTYHYSEQQKQVIRELAASITSGKANDFQKIKAVCQWMSENVYYDYYYLADRANHHLDYFPYEVIQSKKTVCDGYARTSEVLLQLAGVPCMYIRAFNHAYNAAYDRQNSRWIIFDATWCSSNVYTADQEWIKADMNWWCFDLSIDQMKQLGNHEIYSLYGIVVPGQEDFSYLLNTEFDYGSTNPNLWFDMSKWYMGTYRIRQNATGNYSVLGSVSGLPVKAILTATFGDFEIKNLDLTKLQTKRLDVRFENVNVQKVDFPYTMDTLGRGFLYNNTSLTSVDFSHTQLKQIEAYAFCQSAIASIKLPNSLESVGEDAFEDCTQLKQIDLSNTKLIELKPGVFQDSALEIIKLPEGLQQIGSYAFAGTKKLIKLDLSKTQVKNIGTRAFSDSSVKEVLLPTNLQAIGDYAFWYCNQLETINLGNVAVSKMGTEVFFGCSSLKKLAFPKSVTQVDLNNVFTGLNNLEELDLSQMNTALCGDGDFSWVGIISSLKRVTFPQGLSSLSKVFTSYKRNLEFVDYSKTALTSLPTTAIAVTDLVACTILLPDGMTNLSNECIVENNHIYRSDFQYHFYSPEGKSYDSLVEAYRAGVRRIVPRYEKHLDDVERFVARMYNVALGRDYDQAGFEVWTRGLKTHEKDGAAIAHGFFLSQEFQEKNLSDSEYLDRLYYTFLDRAADPGGKEVWLHALQTGSSRIHVLAGFVNSKEFTEICQYFGIERGVFEEEQIDPKVQFVERLYNKVLGRGSDEGGLKTWVDSMANHERTPEDVARIFFFSKEFMEKNISDSDYLEILYQTFLDRASDSAGKEEWMKAIRNGKSRELVMEGFSRSKEFGELVQNYGL